jgi:hypothetical protein
MRKVASRKKPSLIRKIFMGPSAAIVAAVVGGVFSLTSAVVPRVLPLEEPAPEPVAPSPEPIARAPIPIPYTPPVPEVVVPELAVAPQPRAVAPVVVLPSAPRVAIPKPMAFEADSLASSLAHAEAKSPARTEVRRPASANRHPNLTYGVWTIFGSKDARGTVWNQSTLKITSQRETPDGLQIVGFLDWRANGKRAGREYVVGNYVEDTRSLFIEGRSSAGCDSKLALSACSAKLSEDGRRLIDGTWGSASARHPAIPGRWQARR